VLLAIDSGNTNVVFAVFDGDEVKGSWRYHSNPLRTADEYAVWLTQLMSLNGLEPKQINAAIIASVVPATRFNLIRLCQKYFSVEPVMVGDSAIDLGIKALVDRPEQVGEDRLVNAVAAFAHWGGDLILIDFGTATSFDVTDKDGNFCGGVLAPGINHSVDALYMASALLPRIEIRKPDSVVGKATVPAMQSGVFWGYIAMIEGVVKRIDAECGRQLTVVATGGLAPLFMDHTAAIDHIDPELTIRGLNLIYKRNSKP
jgi:type III pantothenate kinase